jgi:type II secretory pathway pseudopilin PulG
MRAHDRLLNRLASEAGFAMPTVFLMLVAALGMAGVAVSTSIQGQGGTVRDQQTKAALAVAESGASQVLRQYNRYGLVSGPAPCAPVGGTVPDGEGWCPEVAGIPVNGGTVSYQVKPTSSELPSGEVAWTELEVVSIASLAGTTRRIELSASSSSGEDPFVDADVKSKDGITLDSNSEIHSGSATNGDITLGPNAKHCGPASVGIGKKLSGGKGHYSDIDCTGVGTTIEDEISLPPVNQGTAATVNDNGRLFGEDLISGNKADACWDGLDGDGEAGDCGPRELLVDNNSSVTLGGRVYSFCKLTLKSNSSLYIASNGEEETKIYFDSPEACKYGAGTVQLDLLSNARITSTTGDAVNVALLFVGSPYTATTINLNSNTSVDGPCEQNFVIYAPYTDIELDSNTKFCGAMAGKSVHLDSNAEIWTSSGIKSWVLPNTAPHYVADRFVDCAATVAAGTPDEGC